MWVTAHEPRQKPISLPCRLDVLTRGLAHCLHPHSLSLRDNIGKKHEKTSLRRAYAPGNVEKWYLTTGFAYASRCFQPRGTLLEDFVHEHACISDRGAMCFKKIKRSSNDSVSLGHCKSEKAFVWAGMWATARKVNTSLRAAYAELARSLRGISPWCCLTMTIMDKIKHLRENAEGNHSWGNHWSNPDDYMLWSLHAVPHVMIPLHLKIPKWNQTATWIFTLTCTYHTCAYAQCLRSTFLAKPLTPPYADQGFACAKCSYDRALIKTSQKGFWGRSHGIWLITCIDWLRLSFVYYILDITYMHIYISLTLVKTCWLDIKNMQ